MTPYRLHPEALIALDELRDYIAAAGPDAADRMITEVFEAIRALVAFPHTGVR